MQNRPLIEISLQEKIVKRNVAMALKYIDIFYEDDSNARLASVDADRKSFLHHALEVGLKEVADKLLATEINDTFRFGRDNAEQTCLFLAAKQGNVEIVKILIDQNKEAKPNTSGYKIWLKPDAKGNVPLHAAVEKRHIAVVQLLLKEIQLEVDAIDHINRINHNGNTPLHLACFKESYSLDVNLIALLIQHGADLTLPNTKQQTPFSIFCQLAFAEQMDLFRLLKAKEPKNDKQLLFLKLYRNYVITYPDDVTLLKKYYSLASSHSLKMYISAKLEFDDSMEIRNFYISTMKDSTTNKIDWVDKQIPSSIFNTIPLYRKKVRSAMGEVFPGEMSSSDEECSDLGSQVKQERYQLLQEDQNTLLKLIKDTEDYMNDVQARRETMPCLKMHMSVLISAILLLTYVAVLILVSMKADHEADRSRVDYNSFQNIGYTALAIIVGIFGFCIMWCLSSCALSVKTDNKVSQNEWKALIDQLRESLLEKLQFLEQKELQDKQANPQNEIHYLPVTEDTIRDLENTLMEFDNMSKTVIEMKDLLGRLDNILKNIKTGMHFTNNPVSMFYTNSHCIVNIPQTNSSELKVEEVSDEDSSSGLEMRSIMGRPG